MHRFGRFSLLLAFGVVACSVDNPGRTTGRSGSTTGTGSGSSSSGSTSGSTTGSGGTTGGDPDGNGTDNCGVQNFMLERGLPPDLLVVLDRSGSMGEGAGSKWDEMTAALKLVVSTLQGQIKWGLEYFPTDNDCGVSSSVAVPVAAMNANAIAGSINVTTAGGSTPTTQAIKTGAAYLQTVQDTNPKYLLLATDGEPNCTVPGTAPTSMCTCPSGTTLMNGQCCAFGIACIPCNFIPDDAGAAAQAVADAAAQGVRTFVIGIATGSDAEDTLNRMAQSGGMARPGTQKYYPVASQSDLVTAINTIAGQIISCSFPLQSAPQYPEYTWIEIDAQSVPRDPMHSNGWDFGPNNESIQFYGTFCDKLQTTNVQAVKAIFGCGPVA